MYPIKTIIAPTYTIINIKTVKKKSGMYKELNISIQWMK